MARIAIVEDDHSQRRLLQTLLESRSHHVEAFANGREALAAIDERFDMVLTDILMPELDGIALCAALRKRFQKTQLPIVIISALQKQEEILEALDAGASDYIPKPFSPSLLQAKVQVHLAEHVHSAATLRDPPSTARFTSGMDLPTAMPARFGHYLLERILGRGSYGIVYEARSSELGPPVALKILDSAVGRNRSEFSRYLREIATLSSLDCETIVRFVAAGREEEHYYLAMEILAGKSTLELVRSLGRLALPQLLRVGADISAALGAIHGEGLVHRDVKPANIIVCDDGRAKLVDFGLAKSKGELGVTSPQELLGTIGYLAPEVIGGQEADPSSDLYSLGVTLYELACGQRAFSAKSSLDVLRYVSQGWPAKPLPVVVPGFPPETAELIAELMAFDRSERLSDAVVSQRRFEALLQTLA